MVTYNPALTDALGRINDAQPQPEPIDWASEARDAANRHGIDPNTFSNQIGQESGYNPSAYNPSGATGIAQLMPGTAADLGVDPSDPLASLDAAARYSAQHHKRFGGNERAAVAAYNWGPGNVEHAIAQYGSEWEQHAPAETQLYLAKIFGNGGGGGSVRGGSFSGSTQGIRPPSVGDAGLMDDMSGYAPLPNWQGDPAEPQALPNWMGGLSGLRPLGNGLGGNQISPPGVDPDVHPPEGPIGGQGFDTDPTRMREGVNPTFNPAEDPYSANANDAAHQQWAGSYGVPMGGTIDTLGLAGKFIPQLGGLGKWLSGPASGAVSEGAYQDALMQEQGRPALSGGPNAPPDVPYTVPKPFANTTTSDVAFKSNRPVKPGKPPVPGPGGINPRQGGFRSTELNQPASGGYETVSPLQTLGQVAEPLSMLEQASRGPELPSWLTDPAQKLVRTTVNTVPGLGTGVNAIGAASQAVGGPALPSAGDIAAGAVPTNTRDALLTLLPFKGDIQGLLGRAMELASPEVKFGVAQYAAGSGSGGNRLAREMYEALKAGGASDEEIAAAFGKSAVDAGKGGIDIPAQMNASREAGNVGAAASAKREYVKAIDNGATLDEAAQAAKVAAAKTSERLGSNTPGANVLATEDTRTAMQQASERARSSAPVMDATKLEPTSRVRAGTGADDYSRTWVDPNGALHNVKPGEGDHWGALAQGATEKDAMDAGWSRVSLDGAANGRQTLSIEAGTPEQAKAAAEKVIASSVPPMKRSVTDLVLERYSENPSLADRIVQKPVSDWLAANRKPAGGWDVTGDLAGPTGERRIVTNDGPRSGSALEAQARLQRNTQAQDELNRGMANDRKGAGQMQGSQLERGATGEQAGASDAMQAQQQMAGEGTEPYRGKSPSSGRGNEYTDAANAERQARIEADAREADQAAIASRAEGMASRGNGIDAVVQRARDRAAEAADKAEQARIAAEEAQTAAGFQRAALEARRAEPGLAAAERRAQATEVEAHQAAVEARDIERNRQTWLAERDAEAARQARNAEFQAQPRRLLDVAPDYLGVQPELFGNEDHNAIIEAFKKSIAGKARELKTGPGGTRSLTSRIGGDLEDPYLAEIVNSESGLRHSLIQQSTRDLRPIDVRGMSPDDAAAAVKDMTSELESIIKQADNGVTRFRNEALDARYGNTPERSIAHGTLVANDAAGHGGGALGTLDAVQNVLKELVLGADLGVTLQQGLKATRVGLSSAVSSGIGHGVEMIGQALGKDAGWLGIYPDTKISAAAQRAADGLIERGAEAVGIERTGSLTESSVTRGAVGSVANKLMPAGESGLTSVVKAPVRIASAGVQALTDVQYAALNKLRVQIYEGRLYQSKLLGQDIAQGSQARKAAAEFANLSTSTARTASDAGRALIEKRVLLTPQMTRSQFAELAQPFKTFRSPAEATNTANQILSTVATFGMAYAINQEFGVAQSVAQFVAHTANPLSSDFGKMTLKATDADGNHLVWNFLPQFSAANAILKSVRATKKFAEGDQSAARTLDQVGNALGTFGIGRLNQGLSDLTKIGGFGYDQDGHFHWGDMPNNQRAAGVAPIPLSAQSALQGNTDPVSVAGNILGGNVYSESPGAVKDRAVQALTPEDYAKIGPGVAKADDYASASPAVKAYVDKLPDVAKAVAANPTDYHRTADPRYAENRAATTAQEDLFNKGQNAKKLPDVWHDESVANAATARALEGQFAQQFANFDKTKFDDAVKAYHDIAPKVGEGLPGAGVDIDFEAAAAARQDYLKNLPSDVRQWVTEALQVSEEKKTPLHQEWDKYIDAKKAAGYFATHTDPLTQKQAPLTTAQRNALDKAHPELDVASWKFNGVAGQSGGTLQSTQAVDQALALKLPNREVKFGGLSRPVNQTPEITKAWDETKALIANFENDVVPKYADRFAQSEFRKPFAALKPYEQALVESKIRADYRDNNPRTDAALAYMGYGSGGDQHRYPINSPQAEKELEKLRQKYGDTAPKPGYIWYRSF